MRSLVAVGLFALFAAGCVIDSRHDDPTPDGGVRERCRIEDKARELAGEQAVDCGRYGWDELLDPGHACSVAAFESGKPFVMILDLQGIDSSPSTALVRSPSGVLEYLSFDNRRKYSPQAAGTVNGRQCLRANVVTSAGEWLDGQHTMTIVSPGQRVIACELWTDSVRVCE